MPEGDYRNLRRLDGFNRLQRRWLEKTRRSPAGQPEIDQMVETRLGEDIDTLRQQQGAIGRVIRLVGL